MTSSYQVLFGDETNVQPADDDFYDALDTLEVEENADLPAAIQFTLPIATQMNGGSEDLTIVDDKRFLPYSRVAVVVSVEGAASDACIFDGFVLAHTIHLDPGTMASTAQIWGQDASCLMNLVDRTQEREGTDGAMANAIFDAYGFGKATENTVDDGPDHDRVIMQRGTDAQFLRERARRAGRLFRVCCESRPGEQKGYFVKPDVESDAVATLHLNPAEVANVDALEFTWDVARPTKVVADALVGSKDAVEGDADDAAIAVLDKHALGDFVGSKVMTARLTATVDGAGELRRRSQALLREAGWFVRCEGEADLAAVGHVLRAGSVVELSGAGQMHSGRYLIWQVHHRITVESHRMRFTLVRNAVGVS